MSRADTFIQLYNSFSSTTSWTNTSRNYGRRLENALLQPRLITTENGKPHETPLGVVTPWDVIED